MTRQNFKVYDFQLWHICDNNVGAVYRASGKIRGYFSFADGVFNGYTKKEIIRILKNKLAQRLDMCQKTTKRGKQ